MLAGTPYLLEGERAQAVAHAMQQLADEVRLLRQGGQLDDATLSRLRKEWRVQQVYETTGIEGNTLSVSETKMVLERGVTVTGKPARDSADAKNMRDALEYLENLAHEARPLRAKDLREIQSLILGDEPAAGAFRSGEVTISGSDHEPPPHLEVPALVDEAFDWLDRAQDCPAPLAASVLHAWLAHIHPFSDGNGRAARAIMNLILIRAGYPIVLIRRRDREVYYDALASSDDGDIAPLVDLVVHRSRDSLRQIERARAEATGVTQAVRRLQERLQLQYDTWHSSMVLLTRTINEIGDKVREESDGHIRVSVKDYDQVTAEDYFSLLKRDTTGSGWLAVVRGHGYTKAGELLLWNGFRSRELPRLAKVGGHGASIFFSEQDADPGRIHPFRQLSGDEPFPFREVAYDNGNYVARLRIRGRDKVLTLTAEELAARMVREFIENYLS